MVRNLWTLIGSDRKNHDLLKTHANQKSMKTKKRGMAQDFRGNKSTLPRKDCKSCGRVMTWRKSWAKNWDAIQFCSDRCRNNKTASELSARTAV
jgi:hypothetical protein